MLRTLGSSIVFICAVLLLGSGLYTGQYLIAIAGILLIAALLAGI